MRISIILPAFNEEKLLAGALAAVDKARRVFPPRGWDSEMIVCDNNSTDRTAEIARRCGATVVFEPVNRIARARNRGASVATGDWFIFVDADSYPSGMLFDGAARAIETGQIIGGGARVRFPRSLGGGNLMTMVWNTISQTFRWAAGSFIFCEAAAFRAIGGFDPTLFASEEIHFSQRMHVHGRASGRRFIILRGPRLVTSERKLTLYSRMELFLTFARLGVNLPWAARQPENCGLWYDGRR